MMNRNVWRSTRNAVVALLLVGCVAACGGPTPEEQLADAQRAYAEGDLRTASIAVRSLLQETPDNAEARLLLGRIALDIGDFSTSESELTRARELGADESTLSIALAEVLIKKGQSTEAQVVLGGMTADQRSPRVDELEIEALLQLNELEAAEERLRELAAGRPEDVETLLLQSRLALARGELDAASEFALKAQAQAPDHVGVARLVGEVANRNGRFNEAGAAFRRSAELADARGRSMDAITSRYAAAVSYLRARDFELATSAVDEYEKRVGSGPAVLYLRASIRFEQADYQGADAFLQEATLAVPNDGNVRRLAGATKLALGELGAARQNLLAALAQQPEDALASRLLAQTLLQQGEPEEALEELRRQDVTSAASLVLLARTLVSVGNPDEAIELLERNADDGMATRETRLALAGAYAAAGDATALERTLRESVDGDEEDYIAVLALMQSYVRSGDERKARELADSLLEERPDDYRAYVAAALFLQSTGDWEQALVRAEAAASRFPDVLQVQLVLASISGAAEKWSQSESAFKRILNLDEANVDAMLGLARIYDRTDRDPLMMDMLERAAKLATKDPRPALILGRIQIRERNFAVAQQWLETALEMAPGRAELHALLGATLLAQGQSAQARQAFEQAVVQGDAAPGHFIALARSRGSDGSATSARRALEAGLDQFPDNSQLLLATGQLELRVGDLESASQLIERVLETAPDNPAALSAGGAIALRQSELGKARRLYSRALENGASDGAVVGLYQVAAASGGESPTEVLEQGLKQFPDSVAIQVVLAQHLQVAGDRDRAAIVYRRLLELQPNNAVTLNNLAWLLYEAGDSEALALAERAIEIAPNSAAVLDTYGVILLTLDRNEEALAALERAITEAPGNAEIRYHFAQAQVATGDNSGATGSLRAVLEIESAGATADGARELLDSLQ
ncbi:MAG: XrtA/PEP-CTERM system TPR-repeat protein PrsT [Pseudomonadota bacterium]